MSACTKGARWQPCWFWPWGIATPVMAAEPGPHDAPATCAGTVLAR
ncbi:hypothetical protein RAA17_21475 [Komagataeibacter rhaeticus]|nr:hypothetical protein [Komagataeibacter rhaeticus]